MQPDSPGQQPASSSERGPGRGSDGDERLSRRDALRRAGLAAGVAWSAPVALSFFARAAASTGSPPPSSSTTLPPPIEHCTPGTCGDYEPCSEQNPDCICVKTAVGGFCIPGSTLCADLVLCDSSIADMGCPPGQVCAIGTCCGDPVCVPVALVAQCPPGNRPGATRVRRPASGGRTIGG